MPVIRVDSTPPNFGANSPRQIYLFNAVRRSIPAYVLQDVSYSEPQSVIRSNARDRFPSEF